MVTGSYSCHRQCRPFRLPSGWRFCFASMVVSLPRYLEQAFFVWPYVVLLQYLVSSSVPHNDLRLEVHRPAGSHSHFLCVGSLFVTISCFSLVSRGLATA